MNTTNHKVDVLVGESWGDEGKGKIVYELLCGALGAEYRACLRYSGGPNAGHSIWIDKKKYVTRQIPSGILKPGMKNLVGRGVRISFTEMKSEIENLMKLGVAIDPRNLSIDKFAHVILPTHVLLDNVAEDAAGYQRIGSTRRGMGPVASSVVSRNSVRVHNLIENDGLLERLVTRHVEEITRLYPKVDSTRLALIGEQVDALKEAFDYIKPLVSFTDSHSFVKNQLVRGDALAEGAQGFMLDIDHGTYPHVTVSNSGVGALIDGSEVPWHTIRHVFGVAKMWYTTRVGNGPFPTELDPSAHGTYDAVKHPISYLIQHAGEGEEGGEQGTVTGRDRRIGWIDFVALKRAASVGGITHLILTKADRPGELPPRSFRVAHSYEGHQLFDDSLLTLEGVKAVLEDQSFSPALRGVPFRDQPKAVHEMVDLFRRYTKVSIPFMSVGPEQGQIVYVDEKEPAWFRSCKKTG